ncbi:MULTISPECIES: hypothetical protein [Pseudomonas]|uniref:Uncharacterized protein n=1 Tax=Pseudomonas bijieensis TaxID=2681983 RepID=A0A6N1CBD6_9PSED|nr:MULTISPECIES: hypothetical protein [Pseudomonas]QIB03552.1 hypothetical protein GZ982_02255 [Pseudomonas fluorescens]QKS81586.1 hypothetical protein GN234_06355 [Pseudomonas bijieensis]WLH65385.1 hypothetical protein PSH86_12710 [Pseudomonas sp. FP2300]
MSTSGDGNNGTNIPRPADPPLVDDVPPSGQVPASILLNGGQTRIPRWPIYADQIGETDQLRVYWRRDGVTTTVYDEPHDGPITQTEFLIPLPVPLWAGDGVAYLYYEVEPITPPGNAFESRERELFIDHSVIPLPVLKLPRFPNANAAGYLLCDTVPPIWEGVHIKIPYQGFEKDDSCVLTWRAYTSLNASEGYIDGTEGVFTYQLTQADAENPEGFEMPPIPYEPHVKPLFYGSGGVTYKISRGGVFIGESRLGTVKVDRFVSGATEPCGPL